MTTLINSIDQTINFNEQTIRIVGSYDNPLFVAIDICKILGLKNVTDTLRSLPDKWKQICDLENSEVTSRARKLQGLNCINEAGLYKLIMRSNKPIAQKFQEVVCEEILPSLRKKGEYKIQSIIDKNKELEVEKSIIEEQLYLKNNEIDEKNSKISELSKYVIRKFTTKFKLGNCVYFIKSSEIKDKIKIGSTININYRISDLSTGSPEYFEVIELFYTEFHVLLEKSIKEIFGKYRISVNCEWFSISVIDEIKNFVISQIELYNIYKKNSNINTICDLVVDAPIYVNEKECVDCKQVLNHKFFFFIDKDTRIYYEKCISCYEKENGSDKKQCSKCVKIKDKIEFVLDKTKKDGLTYECKDCRNEFQRDRKKELKEKNKDIGKINCTKCNEFKLTKMFFILNDDLENIQYSEECKECYCEEHGDSKQCFTCKEIKLFKFYDKKSTSSDGYETYCKACRKIKRDKESSEKKEQEKNDNKKQCMKCQEFLKFNMFLKYIDKDDTIMGYYDECMNCHDSLQCNKCNTIKEKTQFSKDLSKRTGYRTICKLCTNNK